MCGVWASLWTLAGQNKSVFFTCRFPRSWKFVCLCNKSLITVWHRLPAADRLLYMQYNYNINHQLLNITDQHKSMSWASHINTMVLKTSRTFELYQTKSSYVFKIKEVKETAYLTLIRPCLEYVSCVWDAFQLSDIEKLLLIVIAFSL